MSEETESVLHISEEEVTENLQEVLEKWPLYTKLTYQSEKNPRFLPEQISKHCDRCGQDQLWQRARTRQQQEDLRAEQAGQANLGGGRIFLSIDHGIGQSQYVCRNCGERRSHFHYFWESREKNEEEPETWIFFKIGQYPPLEEKVHPDLAKALAGEDLDYYKSALRLRNFGLGIGACAYIRRVVENRINDLLDVLVESAAESGKGAEAELLKGLKDAKESKNFDRKLEYASKILPNNLGTNNPLGHLHEVHSEGLHSKSESECIDIFDGARFVFEYVFKNLKIDLQETKEFTKQMGQLAQKRGERDQE